jgi:hypothetical protein
MIRITPPRAAAPIVDGQAECTKVVDRSAARIAPLEQGSVTARVLAAVWAGAPAVVIESPPGAGKTTSIVAIAGHLAARAGFRIAIAAQTNSQALDIANRLAVAPGSYAVSLLAKNKARIPAGLHRDVTFLNDGLRHDQTPGEIVVATAAKWAYANPSTWPADLLIVDEAWQLSWQSFGAIHNLAPQYLLVGDPGQIDPIVTADVSRWAHSPTGPHPPAPDALAAHRPDIVSKFQLPHTRRFGPVTTSLIQPAFYPHLPFTSTAENRVVVDRNGRSLPEVETITVDAYGPPEDPAVADAVAARVCELIGTQLLTDDGATTITATDIGVVVAHVAQEAAIRARLARIHPHVTIDTAERWQGLERDIMIVVDPMCGHRDVTAFNADPGRLCVMLSRHRAHATFITRTDVATVLDATDADHCPTVIPQREFRRRLAAL